MQTQVIAASIMSKTIAAGSRRILLDAKWGLGALMTTMAQARQLALLMVSIRLLSQRKVIALLSDMYQPSGYAVGNAIEVAKAIAVLNDQGHEDILIWTLLVFQRRDELIRSSRIS